jgi:trimethylamine:corrinoid methyltransferase-like protein
MSQQLNFLTKKDIVLIKERALSLLKNFGVTIHNREVLDLLGDHGGHVDITKEKVFIGETMVEKALQSVPPRFNLYNRSGDKSYTL